MAEQAMQQQLRLLYTVANDGKTRGLEVMEDKYVWEVINMIERQIGGARRPDMTWQRVTETDVIRMEEQKPVAFVKELMTRENEMFPPRPLSAYDFPSPDRVGAGDMHILVVKPGHIPVEPVWKEIAPLTPNLEDGILSFVNREDAVTMMMEIHFSNYVIACSGTKGGALQIPLADNTFALGKTELGRNYIDRCGQMLNTEGSVVEPKRLDILRQLATCHTVFVEGAAARSVVNASPSKLMNNALAKAISEILEPGTMPPVSISDSPPNFAKHLVRELGPLFVVLDDFEQSFESHVDMAISCAQLIGIINDVLVQGIQTPHFHCVLLAKDSVLETLGERPNRASPCGSSLDDTRSVRERWNLSPSSLTCASDLLYRKSAGVPQKLVSLLRANETFQELELGSTAIHLSNMETANRVSNAVSWQSALSTWFASANPTDQLPAVNLKTRHKDDHGREVLAPLILDRCYLSWTGSLDEARICAHPEVWSILASILSPFQEYVTNLSKGVELLTPSHAECFEWLFLKKFQDLLCTQTTLPEFLGGVQNIDRFEAVQFPFRVCNLPQITGSKKRSLQWKPLQSPTANQKHWSVLLAGMLEEIALSEGQCLFFKPLAQSNSADVIIMAHVDEGGDRHVSVPAGLDTRVLMATR